MSDIFNSEIAGPHFDIKHMCNPCRVHKERHNLGYLYSTVLLSFNFSWAITAYLICGVLTHIDLSVPLQIHTTCADDLNLTVQPFRRSWFNQTFNNTAGRAAVRGVCAGCVCKQMVHR